MAIGIVGGVSSCEYNAATGRLLVKGWFLPRTSYDAISICNESDRQLGQATLDQPRPDVLKAHPEFEEANAGWTFKQGVGDKDVGTSMIIKLLQKGKEVLRSIKEVTVVGRNDATPISFASLDDMRAAPFYRCVMGTGEACSSSELQELLDAPGTHKLLYALAKANKLDAQRFPDGISIDTILEKVPANPDRNAGIDRAISEKQGVSLSEQQLEEIHKNDFAFLTLAKLQPESFLNVISEKYEVGHQFIQYILKCDLELFRRTLNDERMGMGFSLFAPYVRPHFQSYQMNFRAIRELSKRYNIKKDAFFDVGCASGVTMFTALEIGYAKAHGCEMNRALFEFGEQLGSVAMEQTGGEYEYLNGDFNTLPLEENSYSLVTLNNVLEHTPDVEQTIKRVVDVLAPDGVCYIFQNAFPSLIFVLDEPHYKDAGLMVLPNDLAIRLLSKKQQNDNFRYVVERWPEYHELKSLFEKYDLEYEWIDEGFPFRPNRILTTEEVPVFQKRILDKFENTFGPHMNDEDRKSVDDKLTSYFQGIQEELVNNPEDAKRKYLVQNWHIILRKKS